MWKIERIRVWFLVAAATLAVHAENAFAQQGFVDQLIPPEFIMQHSGEIELSDEQHQKIAAVTGEFGSKLETLRSDVDEQNIKLGELLRATPIDEATALKHLRAFLSAEQKLKQLHFTAMIRIRNVLTAKQQATLSGKMNAMPGRQGFAESDRRVSPQETEQRLRGKVAQIKKEVELRASKGTPPLEAVKTMETFSEAMKIGRVKEAEAVLDRVMKMLDIRPAAKSVPGQTDKQGTLLRQPPKPVARLAGQPALSYAEVKQSVRDLHVEDVAWRTIDWETCLLEGLRRSRSERKPLVLWVFIDRPIDDERC